MFSPIMRFIFKDFRLKKFTKFSLLLTISVITFCFILIITSFFTFYSDSVTYFKHGKSVDHRNTNEKDKFSFLMYNESENSDHFSDYMQFWKSKTSLDRSIFKSKSSELRTLANWTERPWFLTNGSLRLSPLQASYLAIWPEESADPNDDRIVNQLMYIPIDYNTKSTPIKSIYLRAKDHDWNLSLGRREFLKCPVSSCQLVPKVHAKDADLILFKSRFDYRFHMRGRKPNQIWAKFEIESPLSVMVSAPENSINWTITYRHDSEIPVPYYKFYPYEKSAQPLRTRNYAANKTHKVAWFVSNCNANNRRLEFAQELGEYIEVDIYGDCGTFECPRSDESLCWQILNTHYKFYLSFENSNCLDYITEKFWLNGLMNDILPIVMGAHPSTYKRLAPPHSYIHVDDFDSPKHLAEYLHILDKNDELYNKYFDWKGSGQIKQIYMWCRVCAMLHAPQNNRVYHHLENWWLSNNTCVPITWTNMTLLKSYTNINGMYSI